MSELFDSLNFQQRAVSRQIVKAGSTSRNAEPPRATSHRVASASGLPDVFPITSTPPFNGVGQRQNTSAPNVTLHAPSSLDHQRRQCSLSPPDNDEDGIDQTRGPHVVWHAPPSPSLQVQQAEHNRLMARALGQRSPMASQAFRDELLRVRDEQGQNGRAPRTTTATNPTAAHKRRQSKRQARRSNGNVLNDVEGDRLDTDLGSGHPFLDSFMDDLDKHLLLQRQSSEVKVVLDDVQDKENVQQVLIQGMDRAFSQEDFQGSPTRPPKRSMVADAAILHRRTNTWARTTSMPSQPSLRDKPLRSAPLLGKRQLPSSPADQDQNEGERIRRSDSSDAALVAPGKPTAIRSSNGSPHKKNTASLADSRPALADVLPVTNRPFVRTSSEQHPGRLRRPLSNQLGRGPRVGLSRSAVVNCNASHPTQSPNVPACGTADVSAGNECAGVKAPFKVPIRRSPRKPAVIFDEELCPTFAKTVSATARNYMADASMDGNTSFDDIDEGALCRALEEVEASQGGGKARTHGKKVREHSTAASQDPCATLPPSDDSFEISIDEDMSAAILSQMDAQGW